MPGLVRKLLIFAAVDGLVLQPALPRNHKPSTDQAIKITYKTNAIGPLLHDRRHEDTAKQTLEAHGIVGLLKVASSSYLISISRREQVALIRGKPVYSIAEVALIPLSSQVDAEQAIDRARDSQLRNSGTAKAALIDGTDSEDGLSISDGASAVTPDPDADTGTKGQTTGAKEKGTSVAEDVITRQGVYGRFTDRWFSNNGWKAGSRSRQGLSSDEDLRKVGNPPKDPTVIKAREVKGAINAGHHTAVESPEYNEQIAPAEIADSIQKSSAPDQISLLPKVLSTTKVFFSSRNFFFAYDFDISRTIASQPSPSPLPLHQSFKSQFFWNKHLLQPFIDAGQEAFTVPLIQGFVGQRQFGLHATPSAGSRITEGSSDQNTMQETMDSSLTRETVNTPKPEIVSLSPQQWLLTLISRRSVDRAGLRYLRRGIDDDGNVANSVETEQILCSPSWDGQNTPKEKLYSYTQVRGSMPLFFSQSPYSLKPIPNLRGSPDDNYAAFKAHFRTLGQLYGRVQAVNLVEKKGNEGKVGNVFQELTEKSSDFSSEPGSKYSFEWFDFHQMCKGMKFENVSLLFDNLKDNLASFGWTTQIGATIEYRQSGILRTNCMDCLDRTNVVQSAAARLVLEAQLAKEGFEIDLQHDPSTSWFNTLWADNGDAISRQYAGTAALKGDFTRTRKRNISGALTDFGLTLSRYYNNIVNDYFAQALIDYLLGNATETIFVDFEADMKGQDYAIDLRKVRQNAIDTCTTICVDESNKGADSEHMVAGWVLGCPQVSGTTKSEPFEECVLLLTNYSLYFCRMDWTIEKLKSFEKIDLDDLTHLTKGTYITSTLVSRDLDEAKNIGFKIHYSPQGKDIVRVNTRSLTSSEDEHKDAAQSAGIKSWSTVADKYLAFKALPPRSSYVLKGSNQNDPSEKDQVNSICEHIARQALELTALDTSSTTNSRQSRLQVENRDVVGVEEAKKRTTYIESIGYSLKKLVWAS